MNAYEKAKEALNFHVKRCKACQDGIEVRVQNEVLVNFCAEGERLSAIADTLASGLEPLG